MVSLKNTCFLLQKKGIPLREYLHPLFLAEQIPLAKESLKAILAMYVEEYTQGIYDRDHGLLQNTGFLGNTPFHLDVGKMVENPSMQSPHIYKKDLEWVIWKINAWIKKHYPAHSQEIGAFLAEEYTFLVHEQLPVPPLSEASWKAEARYENEQKIS